jgi:hypothetical protein
LRGIWVYVKRKVDSVGQVIVIAVVIRVRLAAYAPGQRSKGTGDGHSDGDSITSHDARQPPQPRLDAFLD